MISNNIILRIVILLFLIGSWQSHLGAQQRLVNVQGTITDEYGQPLMGVVVSSNSGDVLTITGPNGEYETSLDAEGSALVFSLMGYVKRTLIPDGVNPVNVILQTDVHGLDQVVHQGYSSQTLREVTGAVATVSGRELEKSPVANLTQTFAGRFSGLITQETYSELSRTNTNLFVRGISAARTSSSPMVMVDGMLVAYNSNQTLEYISAGEIESITILKDAATQALYGIQGANGLIVVTTKRGTKGGLQINARYDQSLQEVTTRPAFYNAAEYATMRNQAAFNDGLGKNYLYSEADMEGYLSGEDRNLYPNNDWYSRFMKDFATMERVGVNITGGNQKVQFFSNLNLMHQGGQFKTEQTEYNPAPNNIWVNYRNNVDMQLTPFLKTFVRLSGNIKRERTSGYGNANVYNSLFRIPPTVFGPVTPAVIDETTGEILEEGGKVITTERVGNPTYGMINRSGYYRHTVTNTNSQFGVDLDLDFLAEGLNWNATMAYQTNSVGSLGTTQDFERWMRTADSESLTFVKKGDNNDTPLAYSKGHSFYYHLSYKTSLDYQQSFGKHRVGALAYLFYQNLTKADLATPWNLPYNRISSGGQLSYGFDDRYFARFDVGYSGSEQYARDNRFTLTPAVSLAWMASSESFLKDVQWLSLLKFRASYGTTANDQSGLPRFTYLDNVSVSQGGYLGYLQYQINEQQTGNPDIAAEISTKQNVGLDLGLFNALTLSVDLFKERMENMVVTAASTIPSYQGVPLQNYPPVNSGVFENQGVDFSAQYSKRFSKDLSVRIGGNLSFNKNEVVFVSEAIRNEDYAFRKWQEGYPVGQEFGYLVDYSNGNGYFNTLSELVGSDLTYAFGSPRLGDLIYKDLNGDQLIDERDKAPIGNGALPGFVYGVSGEMRYKNFELNLLFQGVGDYSTIYGGMGVWETTDDGIFGTLHSQAWTADRFNKGEAISYPALSLSKTVNHESNDFFNYDRSYLRLKNVELAYTLPASVTKALLVKSARVILSGQNLLTWDKMKSDDFGPEGVYNSFPVYRVYNLGVSVLF